MSLIFISNYVATMSCYPPLLPSSSPPHPAAHWHSRPCYGLGFGYSLQPRTDKAATVRGSQSQSESVPDQSRPGQSQSRAKVRPRAKRGVEKGAGTWESRFEVPPCFSFCARQLTRSGASVDVLTVKRLNF